MIDPDEWRSSMMFDPNSLLGKSLAGGKYELQSLLGTGAMGAVFQARHVELDRVVAIKVLSSPAEDSEHLAKRFRREAKAASRLDHPHIVQVHDFGQDGELLYLVMDLIGGMSIDQLVAHRERLEDGEIVHIMTQVTSALAAAHESGIVHRDIKPANVVLESRSIGSRGRDITAKVCDFGLAKAFLPEVGDDLESNSITGEHEIWGTPEFMSPEQGRGDPLDPRSDIYACGALMYFMATGRPPFEGDSAMQVIAQHLNTAVVPPRRFSPTLSAPLEAVILRALRKDPEERQDNVRRLRKELRYALVQDLKALKRLPDLAEEDTEPPSAVSVVRFTGPAADLVSGLADALARDVDGHKRRFFKQLDKQRRSRKKKTDGRGRRSGSWRNAQLRHPSQRLKPVGKVTAPPSRSRRSSIAFGAAAVLLLAAAIGILAGGSNDDAADRSVSVRSAPPGATVTVDSRVVGFTPIEVRLPPHADASVHIRQPGYQTFQVRVRADEATDTIDAVLDEAPQYGIAVVKTVPSGAVVQLDGMVVGTTPLVLSELWIGRPHNLLILSPGYTPVQRDIVFEHEKDVRELLVSMHR